MEKRDNDYLKQELEHERKDAERSLKRERSRRRMILFGALIALIVVLVLVDYGLDQTHMAHGLSVFGVSVSGLSPEDAAEKLEKKFQDTKLIFTENKETLYETTLGEAGFSLDESSLLKELTKVQQEGLKGGTFFEARENIKIGYTVETDEAALKKTLSSDHFSNGKERTESTDAYLMYDEEEGAYVLVPSWQGDAIDEDNLREVLSSALGEAFSDSLISDEITVRIDVNSYETVNVNENEEEIVEKLDALNTKMEDYKNTEIVYTFGDEAEILSSETILSWLTVSIDGPEFDTDKIWEYINDLAGKYDTKYNGRSFLTTSGRTVFLDVNEYGFVIDQVAEYDQLTEDLESGTSVTRDPVYAETGLYRNGSDDLCGSYIEVSLDDQKLWLYKDYGLILETDIVSGQPTEERATLEGCWPIAYKASPYTLSSEYYGYETDVTYWMPFANGQGLHDAIWQSSFGGTRYQTAAGSHGCINLSLDAAATVYNNITGGYPIIIYSASGNYFTAEEDAAGSTG